MFWKTKKQALKKPTNDISELKSQNISTKKKKLRHFTINQKRFLEEKKKISEFEESKFASKTP